VSTSMSPSRTMTPCRKKPRPRVTRPPPAADADPEPYRAPRVRFSNPGGCRCVRTEEPAREDSRALGATAGRGRSRSDRMCGAHCGVRPDPATSTASTPRPVPGRHRLPNSPDAGCQHGVRHADHRPDQHREPMGHRARRQHPRASSRSAKAASRSSTRPRRAAPREARRNDRNTLANGESGLMGLATTRSSRRTASSMSASPRPLPAAMRSGATPSTSAPRPERVSVGRHSSCKACRRELPRWLSHPIPARHQSTAVHHDGRRESGRTAGPDVARRQDPAGRGRHGRPAAVPREPFIGSANPNTKLIYRTDTGTHRASPSGPDPTRPNARSTVPTSTTK
jgi:hypothetical protein